jgi:hypothetical protein
MDEPRRDEARDDQRRAEREPREADEHSKNGAGRNQMADRPGLTERERQERWPVG